MVLACLRSLLNLDYPRKEIVLIDNASTDGSVDAVCDEFPAVRVIRNAVNVGFGPALNQGIRATSAPYLAFVNNDAMLDRDWLKATVKALAQEQGAALATGPVELVEFPGVLWGCGGRVDLLTGLAWDVGKGSRERPDSVDVDYVQACVLLAKRDVLERAGLWDGEYFLYFEDTDLACRLRSMGYRFRVLPTATVYHHGLSSTMRAIPRRKFYLFVRSNLRFVLKNFPWRFKATAVPLLLLFYTLLSVVIIRNIAYVEDVARALAWNLENLRATMAHEPLPDGVLKVRVGQLLEEILRRRSMGSLLPY